MVFDMDNTGFEGEILDSKVSVIIPIYNVEKYLRRCVDSVISQTYRNLEIILVDDGSTDNCPAICDEYAQRDDRIIVIHKENGGLSDARNAALEIMSGEYVTFVDSDDFIRRDMVEVLRTIIDDADIAVGDLLRGENDSFEDSAEGQGLDSCRNIFVGNEILAMLFDDSYRNSIITAWGKLYKRGLYEGIRYPKGRINEDEYVVHHILGRCHKVITTNEKLYYYYMRNGSIMLSKYTLKNLDILEALEDRINLIKGTNDNRLMFLCYRDYLRRVQFHYYSLKSYYPDSLHEMSNILDKYKDYYSRIKDEMSIVQRARYGLFIWAPNLNRVIKEICGARKI